MNFEMNVDQEYDEIFKQAVRMADQLKVELNIVRVAKKWIPQDNVPASLPEKYYKRALVTPIIDSFISEMTSRFNKFNCKVDKLLILAHQFYILKNVEEMLTFPQFWKCMKKI